MVGCLEMSMGRVIGTKGETTRLRWQCILMEDVFYFTREWITLADIERLAREAGYRTETAADPVGNQYVRIYNGGHFTRQYRSRSDPSIIETTLADDFWDVTEWRDFDSFEDADLEKLTAYQPAAAFGIAHHISSLPLLTTFLEQVLQAFGGWVGRDDDWEVTYDARSIATLRPP
jgi:hypothetical protein